MWNNTLTGTVPSELAKTWPKLANLDLGCNRLAGEVLTHRELGLCGMAAASSGDACMVQLTTWATCRHHPKCLVRTAAALPRPEQQHRCGCVLSSGARAAAWQLLCRSTCSASESQLLCQHCCACAFDDGKRMVSSAPRPRQACGALLRRYSATRVWGAFTLNLFKCFAQPAYRFVRCCLICSLSSLGWQSTSTCDGLGQGSAPRRLCSWIPGALSQHDNIRSRCPHMRRTPPANDSLEARLTCA